MAEFNYKEYADIVFAYGLANSNIRAAQRMYREPHPDRRVPRHNTFTSTFRRLRETGNLASREPRVNARNLPVFVDEDILRAFDNDPTTSVRRVARDLDLSVWKVWSVINADGRHLFHYTQVQGIPTSLCKSKQSYTISAEKNLQMCQQNGRKIEEPVTKISITDHIISSMDACRKKDLPQRSTSVHSEKSTDSSSNSVSGRHQLPPIISEIPDRRKNKVPSAKTPGVEPRPNGQRTRSLELPLPDFTPRKQIVSRRQTVISTENIGCGRTAADGSEAIATQDSPINLSLKKKETELSPRTNVYEQHATCSVATFTEIHQQISRMENANEYRVEDFRNSITTSIIRLVRSVMEENSLTVQVILILNEWFRELHRVMKTDTTSEQMKSKIVEALNEVVNYLCCHIFSPAYPYKCKVLIEDFIQINLQPHAELLRQTVPLLAKAGDRYQWMLQLTKILNENSSRSGSPIDTNARSDVELDAPNRDELASHRIANGLPSGIANESPRLIANELPSRIPNELPSLITNKLTSRISNELPSQITNELSSRIPKEIPNRIPHAHKPQKTVKKMVESHNSTDGRPVRIALQNPSTMGADWIGRLSRSIEPVNLREPPAAAIAQGVERQLDVSLTQANIVLEQTVEVRDTSMEVTKETDVAVRTPTATGDDVVLEKVQEDVDHKEDVKDFKFDLNDFQQMYMQTTSRKKLRQLMHMLKEDHFDAYQKVMEKFGAVPDPNVKEIITIDDDDNVVVVQSNAVPEPAPPATTTAVTSPKRKVEENAKTSPPKKVKIGSETPKAKTGSSSEKDLNQNYVVVKQSVIVQQKRKKSSNTRTTAHPPTPPPPVIEDISSEEDTTPRPFCDMAELPLSNELAYMNLEKSSPGNIVYAKAMPPHPPPVMPSCSKLKTHPPYYKPRVNGNVPNKSYLSPERIIAQRFPPTTERLRPTTPLPRTQLPVVPLVKPGVNWKTWMSEERRKSFFGMARSPVSRRQSVETISSVGSDYSPKFSLDDNLVDVKIDSKWYRIKKRLYDRIPKGKLCYIRETNTFVRYFDDAQMEQFVKNLNINVASAIASDLMKQIRCRKESATASDTFVGPRDASTNNEVIHVAKNVTFCPDDKINDPEMYVQEVEKVEEYVPLDFLGFYKFVTGYQIIHNHPPISFQTFLIMHNTNGIRDLFKKYVNSLIEGRTVL